MEWRLPEELINYILDTACEPYQELVHYFEWPSNTPELVDHDRRSRVVRRKLAGIFDSICKKITRSRRNRVGSVLLGFDWANFCVPYSNITELVLHSNPFEKANISSERVSEAMIENSIAFLRRLTVSELRRLESVTINLIPPFHLPPHKIIIRLFSYLPTTLKRLKISIHMLSSKDLCVILETLSRFRQLQHLDIDGHLLELMSTEYSAEDDFIRGDRPRFARVLTEALQNCKSTLKSLGLPNIFDLIYDMRRFPDLSSLSALEDLVLHTFISKEPQVLNYDLGDDGKTLPPFIQFCRDNLFVLTKQTSHTSKINLSGGVLLFVFPDRRKLDRILRTPAPCVLTDRIATKLPDLYGSCQSHCRGCRHWFNVAGTCLKECTG
jgi:hypothetical protein